MAGQASMRAVEVRDDAADWFSLGEPRSGRCISLDAVLMRKDPPFDMEYVYTTYLLELARDAGCLVVNDPQTLRDANEKVFAAHFPQCCPPLTVTRRADVLRQFLAATCRRCPQAPGRHGRALDLPRSTRRPEHGRDHRDPDRLRPALLHGPALHPGDRTRRQARAVGGRRTGAHVLARIPAGGDSRGNLAAGARAEVRPLSSRDRWIASRWPPACASAACSSRGSMSSATGSPRSTSPAPPVFARSTVTAAPTSRRPDADHRASSASMRVDLARQCPFWPCCRSWRVCNWSAVAVPRPRSTRPSSSPSSRPST
jgi:hypothetical protein